MREETIAPAPDACAGETRDLPRHGRDRSRSRASPFSFRIYEIIYIQQFCNKKCNEKAKRPENPVFLLKGDKHDVIEKYCCINNIILYIKFTKQFLCASP
jgi:hypothetical protein